MKSFFSTQRCGGFAIEGKSIYMGIVKYLFLSCCLHVCVCAILLTVWQHSTSHRSCKVYKSPPSPPSMGYRPLQPTMGGLGVSITNKTTDGTSKMSAPSVPLHPPSLSALSHICDDGDDDEKLFSFFFYRDIGANQFAIRFNFDLYLYFSPPHTHLIPAVFPTNKQAYVYSRGQCC